MIVTVGGQAASGKSTLAKALAKRLGYKHLSAGQVMRDMAKEKGMTLVEFSRYAEEHPEVDKEIDMWQKKEATDDCVVDGRLSRHFLAPDMSIWLVAPARVRAERAMGREKGYGSVEEAEADITKRDDSERKRYKDFYDIDLYDLGVYDLVLNTGRYGIKEMTDIAVEAVESLIE